MTNYTIKNIHSEPVSIFIFVHQKQRRANTLIVLAYYKPFLGACFYF